MFRTIAALGLLVLLAVPAHAGGPASKLARTKPGHWVVLRLDRDSYVEGRFLGIEPDTAAASERALALAARIERDGMQALVPLDRITEVETSARPPGEKAQAVKIGAGIGVGALAMWGAFLALMAVGFSQMH